MGTTLASYVKAVMPADSDYVEQCVAEAKEMVANHIGKATVPTSIVDRAELEVGAELFHRRQSRNGIAGLDGVDAAPMRIARDPMKAAAPLLAPYLGPGIA